MHVLLAGLLILSPACRNKPDTGDSGSVCTFYEDLDGDGWGTGAEIQGWCDSPPGEVAAQTGDCDDGNGAVNPGNTEVAYDGLDNDCDETTLDDDLDLDGYGIAEDCDDDDPDVNPGATEVCNGLDDDCNGEPDDALGDTFYADFDEDGYGDPEDSVFTCEDATGYVADGTDCDDTDAEVNPGATEVCNGLDDDCDLLTDTDDPTISDATTVYYDGDGDGFGDAAATQDVCEDVEGWVTEAEDCDDTDAEIHPDATEVCDGEDNDCDSLVDDEDDSVADQQTWWLDGDEDGVGSTAYSVVACEQPEGFSADSDDCDDADPTTFPGANEACDGADNDCDGDIDENATDAGAWYADTDGDGFGDPDSSIDSCDGGTAYVADDTDCDDTDAAVNPGATELCNGFDDDCDTLVDDDDTSVDDPGTWYLDLDGDGYGDAAVDITQCEQPTNAVTDDTDCDDTDAAVNPGAAEVCNGDLDDDCDGLADGDDPDISDETTWYLDYDGDGFGNTDFAVDACEAPDSYVSNDLDCDDAHAEASPLGTEACDGLDNDCDGTVDDLPDSDGDGYDECSDCDDTDGAVNPGATETCSGVDDDCDGLVDDDDTSVTGTSTWWLDGDGDGFAGDAYSQDACEAPSGFYADSEDCDDGDFTVNPDATETCDGVDNDCDGDTDEDSAEDASTWYADSDGDGYGDPDSTLSACDGGSTHVADATDCDDTDAAVNPAATEVCNGVDDDCDLLTDIDDPTVDDPSTVYHDSDGDGFGDATVSQETCEGLTDWVDDDTDCDDSDATVNPDAEEVCDGEDDDCDTLVDDDDDSLTDATTWWLDNDGDGVGATTYSVDACELPDGFSADSDDCDDSDATSYPGANEACDGADNDCDGDIDENASDAGVWYADTDGDGYGDADSSIDSCDGGTAYVADDTDCDDGDAAVNPGAAEVCNSGTDDDCDGLADDDDPDVTDQGTWHADTDGDGYGDADSATTQCDQPSGTVTDDTDCDDSDAAVNPSAAEVCNSGTDDDCDSLADSDDPGVTDESTWYLDFDGDGYGTADFSTTACEAPSGYVTDDTDCDDSSALASPAGSEICDGLDNDCDGVVDTLGDSDGDGYDACDDCNDTNASINPAGTETCSGLDDDCDGLVDDEDDSVTGTTTWWLDGDVDGYAGSAFSQDACEAPADFYASAEDCDDGDAAVNPGADEVCDGVDNDCDGDTDEDAATDASTWYADSDGDGFGDSASTLTACDGGSTHVADATDCDDTDAAVNPDEAEVCNGVDDDCDSLVDDDDSGVTDQTTWFDDGDGDGYGDASSSTTTCDTPTGAVTNSFDCDDTDGAVHPGASETCNGVDDDCDTLVDDDDSSVTGTTTWWLDGDGDGHGGAGYSIDACLAPSGFLESSDDCNDGDPLVSPSANEACNSIDDDCDGDVDESSGDASTWYADTDGDGYGDAADSITDCDGGTAYVSDSTDCDDTDAAINPGEDEVCNGVDDDCDTLVDDDDSDVTDPLTYYDDTDGDGYGDPATETITCDSLTGLSTDNTDCDDTDAAVNPGASETCSGVDDDCDDLVDDDDPDVTGTTTWNVDYDGDSYGSSAITLDACDAPTGFVADDTDCDDTDADTWPGADEYCDGHDDDCDGDIDESSAVDVATWYADVDGDGYGDAGAPLDQCDQPSGHVADDQDCDDTNANSYPGARERADGEDNDCDGAIDEDLWLGTGVDGALDVTGTTDLGVDASGSRTEADAISFVVTALSGDTVTVDEAVVGIEAGDEVLLINLHGSDAAHSAAGTYELQYVASVSGSDLVLEDVLAGIYGETDNSDLTDQTVLVQRVPNYTDVTVSASGWLTTGAWDTYTGGIVAFRANGTVTIESGGTISVDELGYWAGETGTCYNCDSFQGESYAGEGDGDYYGGPYNEANGAFLANYGGGGANVTGGGGNYGGGATPGDSWNGGGYTPPEAGDTYGEADLSLLFHGSGGGGVWQGSSDPGPGGDGAGILLVFAQTLDAQGPAALSAEGGTTTHWATGSWTYGAGGGAGGSIWVIAEDMSLAADAIVAEGGLGEDTHIRIGGDGGVGRIRVDFNTLNGFDEGTSSADTELDAGAEPDPGYSVAP